MISAGNDIISLDAIDITRTKQPRFYSKILSSTEKNLYDQAEFTTIPFENFVWLLWSIKESAYKYLKRIDPNLVFIPVKFIVTHLHVPAGYISKKFGSTQIENKGFEGMIAFKGLVTIGDNTLYSRSLMYRELIVSTVNRDEDFGKTCWGIKLVDKPDPQYQSEIASTFLVERLQRILHLDNLVINKNPAGVPLLFKEHEELPIPVSLSHHDHFVGYSFQLCN